MQDARQGGDGEDGMPQQPVAERRGDAAEAGAVLGAGLRSGGGAAR
nr:hypothetical protein [Streptomyces sp. CRN 30]